MTTTNSTTIRIYDTVVLGWNDIASGAGAFLNDLIQNNTDNTHMHSYTYIHIHSYIQNIFKYVLILPYRKGSRSVLGLPLRQSGALSSVSITEKVFFSWTADDELVVTSSTVSQKHAASSDLDSQADVQLINIDVEKAGSETSPKRVRFLFFLFFLVFGFVSFNKLFFF